MGIALASMSPRQLDPTGRRAAAVWRCEGMFKVLSGYCRLCGGCRWARTSEQKLVRRLDLGAGGNRDELK